MKPCFFPIPLGALLTVVACSPEEIVLVPFSEEGLVDVYIVDDAADCDGITIAPPPDLISTVASNRVATVTVSPQCGPSITTHRVLVSLIDPKSHEDVVVGATLVVQPGNEEREYAFELEQDSAAPSQWGIDLDSHGAARVDTFVFQLLQAEALAADP